MASFRNTGEIRNQAGAQTFHGTVNFVNSPQRLPETSASVDKRIIRSLSFPQMHDRRDDVQEPHTGTCEWILKLEQYQEWSRGCRGLLWIKGTPGTGKSTLMKFLYDKLRHQSDSPPHDITLDFFLSARGVELQRTPGGMLRALLARLIERDPESCENVRVAFQEKEIFLDENARVEWKQPELEKLFRQAVLTSAQHRFVDIFIDALDEAGEQYARAIARYFNTITGNSTTDLKIRICISSRPYPIVPTVNQRVEIIMTEHNADDISRYVQDKLVDDGVEIDSQDEEDWQGLKEELIQRAKGMFQWVVITVNLLTVYISEGQGRDYIRKKLREVPEEVGGVYKHILQHVIKNEYRHQSLRLFQWVCWAKRPLSVTECRYAMAAENASPFPRLIRCVDTQGFIGTDEQMKKAVKAWSGGLIESMPRVDRFQRGAFDILQVIHQTVNDYLNSGGLYLLDDLAKGSMNTSSSKSIISEANISSQSHKVIYRSCLNYLSTELMSLNERWQRSMGTGPEHSMIQREVKDMKIIEEDGRSMDEDVDSISSVESVDNIHGDICKEQLREAENWVREPRLRKLLMGSALMDYAVGYLFRHAESAGTGRFSDPEEEVDLLRRLFPQWLLLSRSTATILTYRPPPGSTLLHVASSANLTDLVEILAKDVDMLRAADLYGNAAIHVAARAGQLAPLVILSQAGGDINAKGEYGASALVQATQHGSHVVVEWLLENNVSVNDADCLGHTSLSWAAIHGDEELFRTLLSAGADVRLPSAGDLLVAVAEVGSVEIMRTLVKSGLDVDTPNGRGDFALVSAVHSQGDIGTCEEMTQLLLDAGAGVNVTDSKGDTVLHRAAEIGLENLLRLLIRYGADVNASVFYNGITPLMLAARSGNENIVRILLQAGAEINMQEFQTTDAVEEAASSGNANITRILLETAAAARAPIGDATGVLRNAVRSRDEETVRTVLALKADWGTPDNVYYHILLEAIDEMDERLALLLIDAAPNLCITKTARKNEQEGISVVEGLNGQIHDQVSLQRPILGSDEPIGDRLLHQSVRMKCSQVTLDLIRRGQDPNEYDIWIQTPLHTAVHHDEAYGMQILLDHGANPYLMDGRGRSALDWISRDSECMALSRQRRLVRMATDDASSVRVLYQSISKWSRRLLDIWSGKAKDSFHSPGFPELGRCLLDLQDLPNSIVAFSTLRATTKRQYHSPPVLWKINCTACGDFLGRVYYVCRTCANINLCSRCRREYPRRTYGEDAINISLRPILKLCQNHDFLRIAEDCRGTKIEQASSEQAVFDKAKQWLKGLISQYDLDNESQFWFRVEKFREARIKREAMFANSKTGHTQTVS